MFFSTMAMAFGRTLVSKTHLSTFLSRYFTTTNRFSTSTLLRFRPLVILAEFRGTPSLTEGTRSFATSSLKDPSPNFSNPPPKKRTLFDGCDFEHWLVFLEKPPKGWTRDEIIDYFIKTLAQVVGSEEEARKKIYSVSIGYCVAFGALVSEEMSYKLKELEMVRMVLPDVRNDNGGKRFINGKVVPYDPKDPEEWTKNNAHASDRSRRNDMPRNNRRRSRNFERILELMDMQYNSLNMVGMPPRNAGYPNNAPHAVNIPNQDYQHASSGGGAPYQNREAPGAMPNRGFQNNGYAPGGNMGGPPSGNQYQVLVRDIPGRDRYYQH